MWYAHVAQNWVGSPGADMIKFWTARYNETWPAPTSENPKSLQSVAARNAAFIANRQPR